MKPFETRSTVKKKAAMLPQQSRLTLQVEIGWAENAPRAMAL
jgi:hypothetical protein